MAISGLCIWFRWICSLFVVVLPNGSRDEPDEGHG
jgi:hypothetical protein